MPLLLRRIWYTLAFILTYSSGWKRRSDTASPKLNYSRNLRSKSIYIYISRRFEGPRMLVGRVLHAKAARGKKQGLLH